MDPVQPNAHLRGVGPHGHSGVVAEDGIAIRWGQAYNQHLLGSPDRADALVWALSELMLGKTERVPQVRLL